MIRFLAIFERDLRRFIRNPIVIVASVVMPILYLIILGSSFQGELKNLSLAVVDMDSGPYAKRIVELLHAVEAGPKTVRMYHLSDQGSAMQGLRDGIFKAVLIIPSDFSRDVIHGKGGTLGFFMDNAESISANSIRLSILSALSDIKNEFISVREERTKTKLREIELYKKIDYAQTLIPGVVIMAIFLGAMTTGAFNMVMDKFLGVEESYFLTPLTKRDIVMGLIASGLLITTILALIVLLVGSLISGLYIWELMTPVSFVLLVIVIILSTLGLQGLMFMIMGRINHPRIVGVLGGFLNVILFFPSGAIYPIESFPGWLKAFAWVNPETYSVHAMRALLFKGAGLQAVEADIVYLSIFAVASVALGLVVFKRAL